MQLLLNKDEAITLLLKQQYSIYSSLNSRWHSLLNFIPGGWMIRDSLTAAFYRENGFGANLPTSSSNEIFQARRKLNTAAKLNVRSPGQALAVSIPG